MIVIAGNNGTKRKRSVKAHVRILPILHLGFNALRQFSQRLSEGGEWALRSESSLAKSKPFFRKKSTYLQVAWSKYETSKFWVLSQPTLRAFVLHLRFISRKMWKTKSLFTRSHIICETCLTYFSFHCRFSKVPALVRTVLKANLVPLKKQKHAWGKNNFLLRYRASACQARVLSDLACSTHTFKKKKKSKTIPLTPITKFGRDAVLSGKNGFLLQ